METEAVDLPGSDAPGSDSTDLNVALVPSLLDNISLPFFKDDEATLLVNDSAQSVWSVICKTPIKTGDGDDNGEPLLQIIPSSSAEKNIFHLSSPYYWGLNFSNKNNSWHNDDPESSAKVGDPKNSGIFTLDIDRSQLKEVDLRELFNRFCPVDLPSDLKNEGRSDGNPLERAHPADTAPVTSTGTEIDDAEKGAMSAILNKVNVPGIKAALVAENAQYNGLWIEPADTPTVSVRLNFKITLSDDIKKDIADFLSSHGFGITINQEQLDISPRLCLCQTTAFKIVPDALSYRLKPSVVFKSVSMSFEIKDFILSLAWSTTEGISIHVRDNMIETNKSNLTNRLGELSSAAGLQIAGLDKSKENMPKDSTEDQSTSLFPSVKLWFVRVSKANKFVGVRCKVGIICTGFTRDSSDSPSVGMVYDTQMSLLRGDLLLGPRWNDSRANRAFNFDTVLALPKSFVKDRIELWKLFGRPGHAPSWLPTDVTAGTAIMFRDSGSKTWGLGLNVTFSSFDSKADVNKDDSELPAFRWASLQLGGTFTKKPNEKADFTVAAEARFLLPSRASDGRAAKSAELVGSITYASKTGWLLRCGIYDLPLAFFWNFFHSDILDGVKNLLGNSKLSSFDVLYTFCNQDGNAKASSFCVCAVLQMGQLELDLIYQYSTTRVKDGDRNAADITLDQSVAPENKPKIERANDANPQVWSFKAKLGASTETATLESCLKSLSPDLADLLPDFVAKIAIEPAKASQPTLELGITSLDDQVALVLWISIADFHVTLFQITAKRDSTANGKSQVKRILRVSTNPFKLIGDVPLIKTMPPLFDEVVYMYIDRSFGAKEVEKVELESINKVFQDFGVPILSSQPGIGNRLLVLNKGQPFVNHEFFPSTAAGAQPDNTGKEGPVSPPSKANIQTTAPFLSISSMAFQYKNHSLAIGMSGTLTLGPIAFTLIGFEISFDMRGISLDNLTDLVTENKIDANIHGLGVSLDRPPLLLAGSFAHEQWTNSDGSSQETYAGGIGVGLKAWKLLAVGEYCVKKIDGKEFTSVFIFARLDGPLITLEFGTISGVRLGFGYNSTVRSPTVGTIQQFPFVRDDIDGGSPNDPAKVLQRLTGTNHTGWVTPKEREYWFVMGMTITAFDMLTITAVAMVAFSDTETKVSIFADGVGQMPPEAPPNATLFYIQLSILAELNVRAGTFRADAVLGSASHVYVPQCRLYGSACLASWFAPNEHEGDFVLSVGGFHREYSPPLHYLPSPTRVGLSFSVGDAISVTGNGYFALTPKVAMAGGELSIVLDVGPVHASADFAFDVFINFAPFHYSADLKISVHCHAHIDIGIADFDVDADIGCQLHLEGPEPFRGHAYVDFHYFGFSVSFGDEEKRKDPLSLADMIKLVQAASPVATQTTVEESSTQKTSLKIAPVDGLAFTPGKSKDQTIDKPWPVAAGAFAFRIDVDFAITDVEFADSKTGSGATGRVFWCKPMQITDHKTISSRLIVSVHREISPTQQEQIKGFLVTHAYRSMASSLWGQYTKDQDPDEHSRPSTLSDGTHGATLSICTGIYAVRPVPALENSNLRDYNPGKRTVERIITRLHPEQTLFLDWRSVGVVADANGAENNEKHPEEEYKRFAADWRHSIKQAEADSGGLSALMTHVDDCMGWNSGRGDLPLNWVEPTRFIDGFEKIRLALPTAVGPKDLNYAYNEVEP